MAVEKDSVSKGSTVQTVKMKYVGHFRGSQKLVSLPIPLISNSQKLDHSLAFTRTSDKQGPAFCEVPIEWAGALMAVGGNWQVVDKLTPELTKAIDEAKSTCDERVKKFALENEMVEA
jgi:hypothetical protein